MRRIWALPVILTLASPAFAAEAPQWAFMIPDAEQPETEQEDPAEMIQLPGSAQSYARSQIDDLMSPPDWFPQEHTPMPEVVARGGGGMVFACASCHLVSGMGHPESSSLAGLSAAYMMRQIADFKSGARTNPIVVNGEPQLNSTQYMVVIARGMTDEQAREASEWFAALDPLPWVEVVETDTVPRTYVSRGYMRLAWPDGAEEPIGNRIVELPQDVERQRLRDPHSGTIAYVPTGSIEEGASLVNEGGGGRTTQCSICHGPDLKGLAEIPSIAGRSPTYIFRQLYSFKDGSRGGASAALMQPAVTSLEESDMIAIAAYLATLEP